MALLTTAANESWTTMGSALAAATTFQCQGTSCRVTAATPASSTTDRTLGIELLNGWVHTFPAGATISYRSDHGAVRINTELAG